MIVQRLQHLLPLVICSLLLAACSGIPVPSVNDLTPEQAARQSMDSPTAQHQVLNILGQRALPSGNRVVLYRSKETMPEGGVTDWFGYIEVERAGLGWRAWGGGAQGQRDGVVPPAGTFVEFGVEGTDGLPGRPVFVYGQRLVPEVEAVEAVFDNGQTVRDDTADGIFVLSTTDADAVCAVRVLGNNDAVLRMVTSQLGLDLAQVKHCQTHVLQRD